MEAIPGAVQPEPDPKTEPADIDERLGVHRAHGQAAERGGGTNLRLRHPPNVEEEGGPVEEPLNAERTAKTKDPRLKVVDREARPRESVAGRLHLPPVEANPAHEIAVSRRLFPDVGLRVREITQQLPRGAVLKAKAAGGISRGLREDLSEDRLFERPSPMGAAVGRAPGKHVRQGIGR